MASPPLHHCQVLKCSAFINRSHTLFHSIAVLAMMYYRFTTITSLSTQHILPWLMVSASELFMSFLWLLQTAFGWRPVARTVYPERLPPKDELPAIDVFVCTADPKKEPPLGVVNTVLSAMALDYPPNKLSVYLSDDGGSSATLSAMRGAWGFARSWVPFCRKFGIKSRYPEAYFSERDIGFGGCNGEFTQEHGKIKEEYEHLKEQLKMAGETEDRDARSGQHHPALVEIVGEGEANSAELPLLVYVSREKRAFYPHHFKAGALNVLLRVSGCISNSPYILILDCDMYCNDPSSARQAMCFHLDRKISPSLAFVQFPQKFHNVSKNDIYDSAIRSVFVVKWPGMDGIRGPMMSGTGFYIKREALYGTDTTRKDSDFIQLRRSFGLSNDFIKSLSEHDKCQINVIDTEKSNELLKETEFAASCAYEDDTQWGKQVGFLYNSLVEDYFTGFILHCRGWTSIFCDPPRPAFLGSTTTNLNDSLVQGTRWNCGQLEVLFSRFCPIIYGLPRMPLLECMCYAYLAFQPLYCMPVWCLAVIPQLCLLNDVTLYPEVSSPWFVVYTFVFVSTLMKYLADVLLTGGTIRTWWNEWRVWMIKSITAYSYGSLDALLKLFGLKESSFLPTNKVVDDEQFQRYQMGIYDFQAATMLLAPLVTIVILNMVTFLSGIAKALSSGGLEVMCCQMFLSLFILAANYPMLEGMILRKDKGSIPLSVTLLCVAFSFVLLLFCSIFLRCIK